jgi:hypothetical protein
MTKHNIRIYTTTANTFDREAISINTDLNDVARMCKVGHKLNDILSTKFNGNVKLFKRYVRANIDKDEKSVIRYMTLADHQDMLQSRGIIRLSEAYQLLGIDGNPTELQPIEG